MLEWESSVSESELAFVLTICLQRTMRIHYLCPNCETTATREFDTNTKSISCAHCGQSIETPADAMSEGRLRRCLVCPSDDLFVRKDFPQQLGISIIAAGFVFSSIAWYFYHVLLAYGILFASALVDAALYLFMGNVVTCYHCHAEYRGLGDKEGYDPFDLEIHERHRQQAARLAQAAASAPQVVDADPDQNEQATT